MPMRNKQKGRVHHQEEQYLKRLLKEKVNKKKQNLRGKVRKKEKETRLIQKIIKQKVRKKEEETRLIQKEITQIERAIYSR
jgi:predicted component of type VI protein secretion system